MRVLCWRWGEDIIGIEFQPFVELGMEIVA